MSGFGIFIEGLETILGALAEIRETIQGKPLGAPGTLLGGAGSSGASTTRTSPGASRGRVNLPGVVRIITGDVREFAAGVSHVQTGALKSAHIMKFYAPATGEVSIDPSVINPLGERPFDYGPVEHARGGSHAFYEQTFRHFEGMGTVYLNMLVDSLPKGE